MDLNRRDLLKSAIAAPLCAAAPLTDPTLVVGSAAVPPEISDWDWPPHAPGDCYVFRQRLHAPPTIALMHEVHTLNRVPWRGCAARTIQIERVEASRMEDGSWRVLRFLRHNPDTFDLKFVSADFPGGEVETLCIHSQLIFQSIDFGQMWQPWDGTWA